LLKELGAIGQELQAIADQAAEGIRDPRSGAPRLADARGGLGRVEPDLGLAVVLQACEGVEEQQGLVRCPSAATSKLMDAVEFGEQGLAVERCRGRWPIEG
jgi:hypothetical protein